MEENKVALKRCCTCKDDKPVTEFCKSKKTKDGYQNGCKKCAAKSSKKYAQRNPDKKKEANKKAREKVTNEDRVKRAEKQRAYHHANRDRLNAKRREYCKRNRQIISTVDAASRKKRRKAIIPVGENKVTPDFLRKLKEVTLFCENCSILASEKEFDLDHIIPIAIGGKHEKINVRYICFTCNRSRPSDASDLQGTKYQFLLDQHLLSR